MVYNEIIQIIRAGTTVRVGLLVNPPIKIIRVRITYDRAT
jgi:hypothetical protein